MRQRFHLVHTARAKSKLPFAPEAERTMDVVLEDSRLVNGWEITMELMSNQLDDQPRGIRSLVLTL